MARVSLKLKHRSITVVLTSLLFLGCYYSCIQGAELPLGACDERRLLRRADPRQGLSALSDRPCRGRRRPCHAVVTAVVLVLFVLLFWLLSRSFLRIATASGSTVRRVYRERPPCSAARARPCLRGSCGTSAQSQLYAQLRPRYPADAARRHGPAMEARSSGCAAPMVGGQGIALILCALVCLLASMNLMLRRPFRSRAGRSGSCSHCRSGHGRSCGPSCSCSLC